MKNTGRNFLFLTALVAAGSLGTNALLWSRYTPERPVLRFGDGNAVTRGAYQDALESADASGDVLNGLLKDGKNESGARNVASGSRANGSSDAGDEEGGLRPMSGSLAEGLDGLRGRVFQVADVDMPMPRRARRAAPRKRIVPKRRTASSSRVTRKPTQRVAGVSLRPNAKPPVSAMDSSRVAGRLRPTAPLVPGNNVTSGAAPLSFAGPGAVEPTGVVAGFPVSAPGATVFSQVGSGGLIGGVGGGGGGIGGIVPYIVGGTAVVGAVVANNNNGGTGGGISDVPPIPEPAPVALATALTLGVAGLMVRARRKIGA